MTNRSVSPDPKQSRRLLDELWRQVLDEPPDAPIQADVDRLMRSKFVAIRYCLPTQLLGKLIDSSLDCLCLQKGDSSQQSTWDPRSFCNKTLVPWVSENQSVLGSSNEPYVGKPLRKPRLEASPENVKGVKEWQLLYKTLDDVETKSEAAYTRARLVDALRSIKRMLADQAFEYIIPERIGLTQTLSIVSKFLSEPSGGDRSLSVTAALFETLGVFFGLYSTVKRYVINAADSATGSTADIECYGANGDLRLAIEVKERDITLTDVRAAVKKARKSSLTELLFSAPAFDPNEESEIQELFERTWASGTSLYRLSIDELIRVGLSLAGEEGRICFLNKVGEHLDEYNTQPANRQKWKQLLEEI